MDLITKFRLIKKLVVGIGLGIRIKTDMERQR
jgi:prefoldin subunit 5